MHRPWPLVGRNSELHLFRTLLASGERFAAIVAGEAGVGKTRLASEWLAIGEQDGLATARVKAGEAARAIPFGALAPLLPHGIGSRIEPGDVLWQAGEAIVARGEGRRLLLLVDDAHLLDASSATLVYQLVASGAVSVVATVRTAAPAPDPVVALWKDELAERVDLAPLGAGDVEELLGQVLGGPVSAGTLHDLGERSAGNALYLRELVLAAMTAGLLRCEDGIWRMTGAPATSSRLVELVEARLGDVDEPERIVLESLAFGEPLGVRCLLGVATAEQLEGLEDRGLIVTASDGRRLEACLSHPMYGEVIRARIPAMRSRIVRQRLGDRVESLGARRRGDALRFATWRLDAGHTVAPALMVTAATAARDRWDLGLARRLADAAVAAGGGFEAAMVRAEVAVLEGRGEEAEDQLAALLGQAPDDAQRVRVVGCRVDNLISRLGRTDQALLVTEEAEALVTDPSARDQLVARKAFALHVAGRLTEALDVIEPLLARTDAGAFGWYIGGACLARAGRFAEALLLSEKLAQPAPALPGDTPTFSPSLEAVVRCAVGAGSGRLADSEDLAAREYEAGVAAGSTTVQAVFCLHLARVEIVMGRVGTAARYATEARNLFRDKQWRNLSRTALTEMAIAHAIGGSVDRALDALAEIDALGLPPDDINAVELGRARAWTAAAAGDLAGAQDHLRRAAELAESRGDLVWAAEALHDLARLGRAEEASPRLTELASLIEGDLAPARADHAAALVSGDAAALSRVSEAFDAMGAWLLAAEASAGAAVALRRAGDARRAVGAERRAAELARRCEGAETPALRAIQTQALLSSREIEVAALAAAGLSNKVIAARLNVSVRTVENHLQRVYEKLGLARRADLVHALSPAWSPEG